MKPTSDQRFLLYFIPGMYFAPDLKKERPHKSVLQRRGEGLPPYTPNQLAGSRLDVKRVQNVYYYVPGKCMRICYCETQLLQQFFRGDLSISLRDCTMAYPQFDDHFPPELHPIVLSKMRNDMFNSIVFVHNPDISCIKPGDIERFKKLIELQDLRLDRASVLSRCFDDCVIRNGCLLQHRSVQPLRSVTDSGTPPESIRQFCGSLAFSSHCPNATSRVSNATVLSTSTTSCSEYSDLEPLMIFLPSCPSREVWNSIIAATKSGFAVTGTAARGKIGPVLGLVDIGESDDSYLFRVSLAGVKRNEREFSCEVENDGKVSIREVTTTGETTVYRYSQEFEMQSQNLCPSGHFSVSFQLPGSVDPHQFTGTFGTDGILEGIVMKARQHLQN